MGPSISEVVISAIPAGFGISIVLLAVGVGLVWYFKLIPNFGIGRDKDDDNW